MEDVHKHMNAKIVKSMEQKDKLVNNPQLKSWTLWGESYGLFELNKKTVKLNKPIQVGVTVLELSKVHMYDFHYNYFLKKYGDKTKLLFTDTDSLCYEVETNDFFDDMIKDKYLYDMSDFPEDHKYHDNTNKKVIGKFKLETLYMIATQFVGFKSKMYSVLIPNVSEKEEDIGKCFDKSACKGVAGYVKKNVITHANYLNVLMNGNSESEKMNSI